MAVQDVTDLEAYNIQKQNYDHVHDLQCNVRIREAELHNTFPTHYELKFLTSDATTAMTISKSDTDISFIDFI